MRPVRAALAAPLLGLALLLGGCAALTPPDTGRPGATATALRSGRLAVQVSGDASRSFSSGFELEGDAQAGRLTLISPIGLPLGRAQWRPGEVLLDSAGTTQRFGDLDTMMEALVGDALPLAALFDWIDGRPWSGASSRPLSEADGAPGFRQLGWSVRTGRLPEGLLLAERRLPAPTVTVRLRLDGPS